jgi:outer membrane protein
VGRSAAWPLPASSTDGRNVTTVGVTLNVPLFAGGATQAQVRQALHRRDGARDELELRRRRVARETLAQYRSVLAGIGQIEATRVAVDSARKALESTRIGQGLGTQTMTDLLLAIQTLAGAQDSYSRARHQFILSRLLLQQAVGAIGETDLAAVNALLQ